jgi:hypothetical protein
MYRRTRTCGPVPTTALWKTSGTRTVQVYTSDTTRLIDEPGTLDGGDVLPGLSIPVAKLFARVPRSRYFASTALNTSSVRAISSSVV